MLVNNEKERKKNYLGLETLMSFICSKHKQTTTSNAQQLQKAFLLAKTEITGEPALMLKLDYARK